MLFKNVAIRNSWFRMWSLGNESQPKQKYVVKLVSSAKTLETQTYDG